MTKFMMNSYAIAYPSLEALCQIGPNVRIALDILMERFVEDSGHDLAHILRVCHNALWFYSEEKKDESSLLVAAMLHDLVNVPKNSPDRARASEMSANEACNLLLARSPNIKLRTVDVIHHAIEAHSFSAGVTPTTPIAKAVQDADRVDALGAMGIARLFSVGGSLGRKLFHPKDPDAKHRELDECTYALDHFYVKLQTLHETMQTEQGKLVARLKTERMGKFVRELILEMGGTILYDEKRFIFSDSREEKHHEQ